METSSCACWLISPAGEERGRLAVQEHAPPAPPLLVWASAAVPPTGGFSMPLADIAKRQVSNAAAVKLRLVLSSGAAHAFRFSTAPERAALLEALDAAGAAAAAAASLMRAFDPLADQDLAVLKGAVLKASRDIATRYRELVVESATLSEAQFWSEAHAKAALVNASATRARRGLSSSMGELEACITPAQGGGAGGGGGGLHIKITDDVRVRTFTREPRVFAAFNAWVKTARMTEADWWTRLYLAQKQRRAYLLEVDAGGAGAERVLAESRASARKLDLNLLTPDAWFNLYKQAAFDDAPEVAREARGGAEGGGGGAGAKRKRPVVARGLDLSATAEDTVRGGGSAPSRGGCYGTSTAADAYDTSELVTQRLEASEAAAALSLRGGGARARAAAEANAGGAAAAAATAAARAERDVEDIMHEVNRHALHVLEPAGDGQAYAVSRLDRGNSQRFSSAARRGVTTLHDNNGVGASSTDDLPDLCTRGDPTVGFMRLRVDPHRFRLALATANADTGGGEEEDGGGNAAAAAAAAAVGVEALLDTGGWGVVEGDAGGGGGGGGGEEMGGAVQEGSVHLAMRSTMTSAPSVSAAVAVVSAVTAAAAASAAAVALPSPLPLLPYLAGHTKTHRATMHGLMRSSIDLWAADARSRETGFSTDVPNQWVLYLQQRFANNKVLMRHAWNAIQTADDRLANNKGVVAGGDDHRRQLAEALQKCVDELTALRAKVLSDGPWACGPLAHVKAASATAAREQAGEEGAAAAQTEIVRLLTLLSSYVTPCCDALHESMKRSAMASHVA